MGDEIMTNGDWLGHSKFVRADIAAAREADLRAAVSRRNKVIAKAYGRVAGVVQSISDEGDRVYFGSSNDADTLRDLAREWDDARILKEDIRTSEDEVRDLRAEVDRLTQANREAAMQSLADLGQAQEALERAASVEAERDKVRDLYRSTLLELQRADADNARLRALLDEAGLIKGDA